MSKPIKGKPSQSTPIRKGKLSPEVIKRTAEELTKKQMCDQSKWLTTTWQAIKTYGSIVDDNRRQNPHIIQEVKAPKIESEPQKGNYKVFAETLKAVIGKFWQFEATTDQLKLFFPQVRRWGEVATNLKRSHWISYRRVENGRNDTYVFFVEPTREELMMEIARLEKSIDTWFNNSNKHEEEIMELQDASDRLFRANADLAEENTQLKSDLFYSKRSNIITFAFAIWAVITIILKSVAL